jgi:hypothetical protein
VALSLRAAIGGTSTASITSIATSLPAGTTTGDLVYIVVTTNTRATAPIAAGWSPILGGDATTTMGSIVGWRTIQPGDAAPTISWTTASTRTTWVAIALAPGTPGTVAAHVGFGTLLAGTTTATSRTPNSFAAGTLSGASVMVNSFKGSATGTTNIATTPPTSWTEPANGDQGTVLATAQQAAASVSYRLAQTGTIAPAAETVAVTAFAYVHHAFAIEAPGLAARFQLVTDALFNTAGLPAAAPFTVCCWAKIVVDRNTWSTIWTLDNTSALSFAAETATDGTMLNLWHGSTERNIQQLVVGTWYKLAYVVSGTTATVYIAAEGGNLAAVAAGAYAAFSPLTFDIGNMRRNGEFLNGAVAAVKLWDAALNTTELAAEFTQYEAVRTTNLNRSYTFFNGPTLTDRGPNARTLTAGSTAATDTAGPNVPRTWAAPVVVGQASAFSNTGSPGTASSISQTNPAATQVGDTVYLIQADDFYTLAGLGTPTGTAVTTWTEQTGPRFDGGSDKCHVRVWKGVVTTGGAATVIANWTTNGDQERYAQTLVFSGPVDLDVGSSAANAATPAVSASLTTTGTNDLLVVAVTTHAIVNNPFTFPATMTPYTRRDSPSLGSFQAGVEQLTAAGATGTRSISYTGAVMDAAVTTLAFKPGSNPSFASITEGFAATDAAKWTYDAGVTVSGGRLNVPCTSSYSAAYSRGNFDLTGSAIFVELVSIPSAGSGSTEAIFAVDSRDALNGVRFIIGDNGTLAAAYKVGGVQVTALSAAYSAVNHRWLRFSESGGVITWATSPDGTTWTTWTTWTRTIQVTSWMIRLQSGYWGTETSPTPTIYDNVNVAPTPTVLPPARPAVLCQAVSRAANW